jgi:hypothetical protein
MHSPTIKEMMRTRRKRREETTENNGKRESRKVKRIDKEIKIKGRRNEGDKRRWKTAKKKETEDKKDGIEER